MSCLNLNVIAAGYLKIVKTIIKISSELVETCKIHTNNVVCSLLQYSTRFKKKKNVKTMTGPCGWKKFITFSTYTIFRIIILLKEFFKKKSLLLISKVTLVIILVLQLLREKGKQERSVYFDLDRRIASTLKKKIICSFLERCFKIPKIMSKIRMYIKSDTCMKM